MSGKPKEKRQSRLLQHMKSIGFTNRLAVYLLLFLIATLAGSFILAALSIRHQYIGSLACWTVAVTPLDTALGVVLNRIVKKSDNENSGADGEGIKYAAAKAKGFVEDQGSVNSPAI